MAKHKARSSTDTAVPAVQQYTLHISRVVCPLSPNPPPQKKGGVRIQTNKQNHLVWFCSTFYGFTHMLPTFPSLISLPYFV